jgi:hypothetical protein
MPYYSKSPEDEKKENLEALFGFIFVVAILVPMFMFTRWGWLAVIVIFIGGLLGNVKR